MRMARIHDFQTRLSALQREADQLLFKRKMTPAEVAQGKDLIDRLAALTAEVKAHDAEATRYQPEPVAQAVARWSHQPLISIRGPFTFNRSGGINHVRNRN